MCEECGVCVRHGVVCCDTVGVVRLACQVSASLSCAQHLEPWWGSSDGLERERGSTLLVNLMNAYQTQHNRTEVSHVPQSAPPSQCNGCGLIVSCVPSGDERPRHSGSPPGTAGSPGNGPPAGSPASSYSLHSSVSPTGDV